MTDIAVQDEPNKTAAKDPPAKSPGFSGDVAFNNSITIHLSNPLPHLDKGAVKAYAATGSEADQANLFAMICEDHLTPRIQKASNYISLTNPSLVKLVAYGPVDWPPAGKYKFCFIYENNLGRPLLKEDTRGGMDMKQEVVLATIIRPVVNALIDMRDRDMVHGCIRLSNIFDGGGKQMERAVLGECLSVPASSHMPVLYEPIERAMASPTGRGQGTIADDLYAFGVCLAILLRENDPLEGMSDDEILEVKIEDGSYAALTGKDRFTGAVLELLRGLLHDDAGQRWTLDEIVEWLDGRRLTPKQAVRRQKASRPLPFNGRKYFRPELLAKDLHKNAAEARQIIENSELEQWITRALESKPLHIRYEKAIELAEEGGKNAGYTDRLITRMSMALHPEAPIRYKNIHVLPDGVGTALTEAFVMKRDMQTYHDFFMNYFISQWIDVQTVAVLDVGGMISRFDGARAFLRQKVFGGGLERCIYTLNANAACLSEKTGRYYVTTPEELMRCFERMAKEPSRPSLFFDRHIVAFLSTKDRKCIDPYLSEISAEEPYKRVLAELKVLATTQRRLQLERFPGIAEWAVDNMEPAYERYHDRELRVQIKKKAGQLKEAGDLSKILALFNDQNTYQEDNTGFRRAMRKHYDLETEYAELERDLQNESLYGRDFGRQVACIVAGILAAMIILATVFTGIGGSGGTYF